MAQVRIAAGHDNIAGLKGLWEIDPPAFDDYRLQEPVYTVWRDWQQRVMAGDRLPVRIGRPSVTWHLPVVYRQDMPVLYSLSTLVTIETLNKSTDEYRYYNATLLEPQIGEMSYDRDTGLWWTDVTLDFYDLAEITSP